MDRRDFILKSAFAVSGIALALNSHDLFASHGQIPYGGKYLFNSKFIAGRPVFVACNVKTGSESVVDLNFNPHTVISVNQDQIIITEKYGPNLALIDFKRGKIVSQIKIPASQEELFMGHGIYIPQNNLLYVTQQYDYYEIDKDALKGFVSIRRLPDLKEIGRFDSGGHGPHDVVINEEGNFLICNCSGEYPSLDKQTRFWDVEFRNVAIVNPISGAILQRIQMPNELMCPSHIKKIGNEYIVSGINSHLEELKPFWWRNKNVSLIKIKNDKAEEFEFPADILKTYTTEFLSIAIHPVTKIVGVTNPFSGIVHFWNLETKMFLKEIVEDFPKSISITSDLKSFIIGTNKKNILVDSKTLAVSESHLPFIGNGMSHTYFL